MNEFLMQLIDVPQSSNESGYYEYIAMMKDIEHQSEFEELNGELPDCDESELPNDGESDELPF